MKKILVFALVFACLLAIGSGAALALGSGAENEVIGEQAALELACADAGVEQDALHRLRCKTDWEDGRLVYELDFIADSLAYEYTVDARDGTILERDIDRLPAFFWSLFAQNEKAETAASPAPQSGESAQIDPAPTPEAPAKSKTKLPPKPSSADTAELISLEEAKAIALERAGLSEDEVVFTKTRRDREKGRRIYDIEFCVQGQAEYDFEIDAVSGKILEMDVDLWEADDWDDWDD